MTPLFQSWLLGDGSDVLFCQLPSAADRVDQLCGRLWWKGKRKLIYCRELCVRQLGHYQDIFSQVLTHAMSKHWLFNIPASHGQYQHIWTFQNIHGLQYLNSHHNDLFISPWKCKCEKIISKLHQHVILKWGFKKSYFVINHGSPGYSFILVSRQIWPLKSTTISKVLISWFHVYRFDNTSTRFFGWELFFWRQKISSIWHPEGRTAQTLCCLFCSSTVSMKQSLLDLPGTRKL